MRWQQEKKNKNQINNTKQKQHRNIYYVIQYRKSRDMT